MLNTQEYFYLKDYLITNYLKDYTSYYCESYYNNSYQNNTYDAICYLSKNDMTLNNNILSGTNVRECKLDFDVYNDNIKTEECQNLSAINFSINRNEISYSSLITADIISDFKSNYSMLESTNLVSTCVLCVLILSLLISFFKGVLK